MIHIISLPLWALVCVTQCMQDMMPMGMDADGPGYGIEKKGRGRGRSFNGGHIASGSWETGGRPFRWGMEPFENRRRWPSSEMRDRHDEMSRYYVSRRVFGPFEGERRLRHRPPGAWFHGPPEKMGFGRNRGLWRPELRGRVGYRSRLQCPKWKKWEESSCLWPGAKPELPKSCHFMNITKRLPEAVSKYYEAKGKEVAEVISQVFKQRGLTKPCGFCSRKIACRKGISSKRPHKSIAFAFVNEECEGGDACRISLVNGGCPAPFPQEKFLKYNRFILKKIQQNDDRFYGPFEYNGHRFGFEQQEQQQQMSRWDRQQLDDPSENNEDDQASSANSEESPGSGTARVSSAEPSSSNEAYMEKSSSVSVEKASASMESPEQNSEETNETTGKPSSSTSKESRRGRGHGQGRGQRRGAGLGNRYTPFIPLWHCVKSEKLNTCLCCCGGYFPDVESGKCILVKHGNLYPSFDMFSRPNI